MTSAEGVALTRESRSVLVGIADSQLARRFLAVLQRSVEPGAVFIASTLPHLFEHLKSGSSRVVVFADDLAEDLPLTEILQQILEVVPVIVLAPQERQTEIATLVAAGNIDFVAQVGDFLPLAASLVERRWRLSEGMEAAVRFPSGEISPDVAEIFRHEINNPLTGILGNAELVLAHEDRMSLTDIQRLRTIVGLAVRLRETIRRVSHMLQTQPHPLKS
jgi:signal transduction histidine kinase